VDIGHQSRDGVGEVVNPGAGDDLLETDHAVADVGVALVVSHVA